MAKKILLVTNDPDVKTTFLRTMVELDYPETVNLACARDGLAGLFRLNETLPDLLIAGLSVSGRNGFYLCQYARKEPELAGTRVLLIDDQLNTSRERLSYDLGADRYLAKPFPEGEMRRAIREILSTCEESAGKATSG